MKTVIGTLVGIMLVLTGCTTAPPPLAVATPILIRPHIVHVTGFNTYRLTYGDSPALEQAFNRYIKTGKVPNIITQGFIQLAYNEGQQPVVKTSPLQETVISLEKGEQFTNVTTGDPNRWSYSAAVSGSGAFLQQHILVKPSASLLATNMVITTNRRLYNLRLISVTGGAIMRNVSFWYPDEMLHRINQAALQESHPTVLAQVPNVNLSQLNFNYTVSCPLFGAAPSWRPLRVFDDGVHTYIQFPPNLASRDLPALWVSNGSNQELVNYRVKSPYFIVDKIFKQAVLVMGVGSTKSQVQLVNRAYQ